MSAAGMVGTLMATFPGELVELEWRGKGAILTFESPTGPAGVAEVWRIQVDPMFGRRADDVAAAIERRHLTLVS